MVVTGTYNPYLVALSILVASFASYTALDLGGHVEAARGLARRAWLVAAAIIMGAGIWSMHFIGMLAFVVPIPMSYDIGLTTVSLVVAIVVTGGAFYVISRQGASPLRLVLSGIFMGLGIVAMHYTGMAAMRGHAELGYDWLFVALSVVIAIGASTAALWLAFQTTDPWQKLIAALVMGLAISGMHYTGMRAAIFTAHGSVNEAPVNASLDQTNLALAVAGITFVILAFASVASLSEQKRAEEARKRAEYLSRQVFETSPDRISIVGRDYRYQRVNPAFERRYGMPAETFVGKHIADFLGREDFEQTAKAFYERCFAGEEVSYAGWFTLPIGRRYLAITYSPLRPTSERVETVLVISRDLTEHVLASEALREAQMELAHVNRVTTMGQLTASIAHEVNQPIAATVTNAQAALRWLDARPPNLEETRQAVARIVNDGIRAGEVVDRIRALIKKVPARTDRFDIDDAIIDVVALTRSELSSNGVSLQTQFAQGLPLIRGDRVQLQQVILNLIVNAIEAMSGVSEGARELSISTEIDASNGALVAVRDSGPGLDRASLEHLFDAFYTTKSSGMGMGLSICRSIIEAHGGRIWAEANVPQGATFQFTLPWQAAP
jgi:PAS domain S-box-containing protein